MPTLLSTKDPFQSLFYPIEEKGFLGARAKEFGVDPSLLRALVRQESVFEPRARSRAGALGLTQLMPATAKSLSRSVLRARYRAFRERHPGCKPLDYRGRETWTALPAEFNPSRNLAWVS